MLVLGSYLDKLAGLGSLLEGATHLVRGEVEGGVARSDMLLDRLDAGAVALLEGFDGLEDHLRGFIEKREKTRAFETAIVWRRGDCYLCICRHGKRGTKQLRPAT